jgi:hypothetical protein
MNTHRCAEYARLQAEVGEVFESLVKLTQAQLNAFRANDQATMMRMDKELENTVGEKERRIGANEAACQRTQMAADCPTVGSFAWIGR